MTMTELTDLERAVLEKFLDGGHPVLRELRRQLSGCQVVSREYTGVGFFSTLLTDAVSLRYPDMDLRLRDVIAELDGLKHGAGFVLYVARGQLNMLEAYTYDEPWPSESGNFRLAYDAGKERDLKRLQNLLGPA